MPARSFTNGAIIKNGLTGTNRQRRADARADRSNQRRFQCMFSLNPIRQGAVQQSVKISVVLAVEQVTELVNDHVFNAPFRRLNQVHIERQPAAGGQAAPTRLHFSYLQVGHGHVVLFELFPTQMKHGIKTD